MAKRKYSDIDDQRLEEYHHPAKALRLITTTIEHARDGKPMEHQVVAAKPKWKKNGFDVDSLLAEKTREVEDEEERPSPTVTPTFHTNFAKSAFQRLYRKKEDFLYTKEYNGGILDRCTKPCCTLLRRDEKLNYGRYPSSMNLYRSRESASTDSAGSSCNYYEHMSADYKRFLLNRRHRDFVYNEELYDVEKLRFPYEYRRPEEIRYLREARKSCVCLDCHSNNKDLFYSRAAFEPIKRNVNVLYTQDKDYDETPVSKRRSLIDELEKSGRVQIAQRDLKRESPTTIKEEIIDEENQELEVVEDTVDYKEKSTIVKQKRDDDLLKLPAASQSRNRAVANLLERRRVAELNTAFERLRVLIPSYGNEDRALSKIKTLKYALTYMTHLMAVLREPSSTPDNDFKKLAQQDPLFQKCREHMFVRKIF